MAGGWRQLLAHNNQNRNLEILFSDCLPTWMYLALLSLAFSQVNVIKDSKQSLFFRLPQMLERCSDPQPMKTGTRRRESKNLFFLLSQIFQFLFLLLFSLKIYVLLKFINAINAMALCASIKDEIMSHYLLCISPLSYDHILIIR